MRSWLPFTKLAAATVALIAHFLFAQASSLTSHNQAEPGVAFFSQSTTPELVISLDGMWRFHPGDNPEWVSSSFDDSKWALLHSDQPWTTQGYPSLSGFAWYRFRVQTFSKPTPLALLLPSILTDYEVYANGVKIGEVGQMPPHGSLRFNQTLLYRLPAIEPGATVQFAIRVWHHPIFATYLGGGPRYGGARLGEAAVLENQQHSLQAQRLNRVVSFYAVGILDAVISITVLGLFLFRRSEREYLWFALLLLSNALLAALSISDFILNFPLGARDFLAEILGALGLVASLFFFSHVLEAKRTWIWQGVLIIAALDPLNVALYLFRITSPAVSTTLRISFALPIEIYIVALLCRRVISGNRNARILFAPTILSYGTAILGGLLLLCFQAGWNVRALLAINQWNVAETPFAVPLQVFVQFIFVVALLAFLIRRFARSRAKEERLTADLEAVRSIQQILIPESVPTVPSLEIKSAYHPAQEVGGDFYQILLLPAADPLGAPDTLIVLGDVAGKGLPAAMTVSLLIGALRSEVETTGSPAKILSGLNRRLLGREIGFTTCIALRVSPSGALTVASAGHLAPYLNGKELSIASAFPLGLDPNPSFPEQSFQLARGDRLTLLTDGIPEAGSGRELFGFERTAGLTVLPVEEIAQTAVQFGQTDDITVISIVFTSSADPVVAP